MREADENLRRSRDAVEGHAVFLFLRLDIFEPLKRQIEREVENALDARCARRFGFFLFGHRRLRHRISTFEGKAKAAPKEGDKSGDNQGDKVGDNQGDKLGDGSKSPFEINDVIFSDKSSLTRFSTAIFRSGRFQFLRPPVDIP